MFNLEYCFVSLFCYIAVEIGVGLSGFGIFFLVFGVLLYFDSVLLAFGNVSTFFHLNLKLNTPVVPWKQVTRLHIMCEV